MAMVSLPEKLKKLANRIILREGLHQNIRRYINISKYHYSEDKFTHHHDHSIPPLLPNCMFRLLCTTSFSTTFPRAYGHRLHITSTEHTSTASVLSGQKSWPGGQYHNPQKQCLEIMQDRNDDVQTVFTIINNHPSSETGMGQALKRSGVVFSNELVEKVLERLRFSHSSGLKALEFFYWAGHQLGHCHTSNAYNTMLFILARMRRFDRVWALMWEMHRRDASLITSKTMQIVLARFAKVCSLAETLEAFELFKKYTGMLDTGAFNALLRSLCQERNMKDVRYVYHRLKHRFPPNTQTFNILLSGWRNPEDAKGFYDEMIQLGCSPDIVTYNSLLDALCKGGEIIEAFKIVEKMIEEGCSPDIKTYTILICGLGLIGQPDKARQILKQMREHSCYPDAAAYNAVINNFCRARRLADAYKLLEDMVSTGVDPNPNTYNIFFRYYYRSRDWKDAWKLYLRMIGTGCLPNTQTCLLLMKMFCSQEQLDMALGLWSDMLQKGCGSYTLVFDVLMDVLCDNGKLDEAERCFLELIDKGHKPSFTSYKRLNVLLELAKKHDVILELSKKMKNF